MPLRLIVAVISMLAVLGGCAQYENKRGVDVTWQDDVVANMTKGETTRKDVLTALGPPSQVIALDDETALYYLYERSEGEGLILIVYNRMRIDTRYDRAVFFFDENDVLTDFATKTHAVDE